MNIRKPVDYSAMFAALDALMTAALPQMELYREIGRLVSGRLEKGAAVAAAEYLNRTYSDTSGFSPRNLRRMREFYRTYEDAPEALAEAMTIGWTQNVVILEAELTLHKKAWYIQAVRQFGWSKLELQRKIKANAHLETALDFTDDLCYTVANTAGEAVPRQGNSAAACPCRLRLIRSPDWDGFGQLVEHAPHLRRRVRGKPPPADGVYRSPRRGRRSIVHRRL